SGTSFRGRRSENAPPGKTVVDATMTASHGIEARGIAMGVSHGTVVVSGAFLDRLSRPAAEPIDAVLSTLHRDPDPHRAWHCLRLDGGMDRRQRTRGGWGCRRAALLWPVVDDLVPTEVSPLVVRLESRAPTI